MSDLYDIHTILHDWSGFSHARMALLGAFYGAHLVAGLFFLKALVTLALRGAGLYHPAQYRLWPRLPWRTLLKIGLRLRHWYELAFVFGKRATGGFAGALATLTLLYKPGQVLLGRAWGMGFSLLQPVGMTVSRHLFMFAMTGAGKTTMLISIISTWKGSVFVIDPKGQITRALCGMDKRKWHVFDVYGITGLESACINVFDIIKRAVSASGEGAAVLWAFRVAEALILTPEGSRSPFFTDTFRGYVVAVILHILTTHAESEHHLPFMYDLMVNGYRVFKEDGSEDTSPEEAQSLLLRAMRANPAFGGVIAGGAAALANASGETGGNVRATGLEQLKWLAIPPVREKLIVTTFDIATLKTQDDVVFSAVAPVLSIREELASLFRLLTNMTAYIFEAEKQKKGQCLTVIDELPSLGHNAMFEVLLPVARSYGQTVLGIAQDVEILRKAYPKSWEGFIGNADAVWWMASNHDATSVYLSRVLGKKSHIELDRATGRKSLRDVEVMSPEQVRRFLEPESQRVIVTRVGKRPLKLVNEPYFKALPVWKYQPDPDHKEPLPRRITRALFGKKPVTGERSSNRPAPGAISQSDSSTQTDA